MEKKLCCFIVPYFGKLPNYFELFLKTCSTNKNFNWLIFTDDESDYVLPKNVKIERMAFENLKQLIQSKFDFNISLERPYKLCDYKPAYGYIFDEYLKNYKFWGHCDLDILLGDLDNILNEKFIEKYDKIFCLGHMILYKNNEVNNTLFMSKLNNKFLYKESFSTDKITIFDEIYKNKTNINEIFKSNNRIVFEDDFSFNVKILPTKFIRTKYDFNLNDFINEKYKSAVYLWENGKIVRFIKNNNEIIKEEFLYIHLQERKMSFDKNSLNSKYIQILPNKFLGVNYSIKSIKDFTKFKKKIVCFHYFQYHYKWQKRKWIKIIRSLKCKILK